MPDFPTSDLNGQAGMDDPREQLEWPDGKTLILPNTTSKRAAYWTKLLIPFVEMNSDQAELVERFVQAIMDEERNEALLKVERALVKEIT